MNAGPGAGLPQAFFLPAAPGSRATGQRFCLFHAPAGTPRGRVLYLHPFAEELNNSRRLVARQARALARAGYAVLQIDLLGCGDSAGAFEDALWSDWQADARLGLDWLAAHASGPVWLWGLRTGALLASDLATDTATRAPAEQATGLLLWQPVASGPQALQQFLRLHAASQWLGAGASASASGADTPAKRLERGEPVEIAGYTLTPALARGLQQARLVPPVASGARRLVWIDTALQPAAAPSPATERQLDAWRAARWSVQARTVTAPAFWQQTGTDDAPDLIAATVSALSAGDAA